VALQESGAITPGVALFFNKDGFIVYGPSSEPVVPDLPDAGVAIAIRVELLPRLRHLPTNFGDRQQHTVIALDDDEVCLVNSYMPAGSEYAPDRVQQPELTAARDMGIEALFHNLRQIAERHSKFIWLGDMNLTASRTDRVTIANKQHQPRYSGSQGTVIQPVVDELKLLNSWDTTHPDRQYYTYHGPQSCSSIDKVFHRGLHCNEMTILRSDSYSDHDFVFATFSLSPPSVPPSSLAAIDLSSTYEQAKLALRKAQVAVRDPSDEAKFVMTVCL